VQGSPPTNPTLHVSPGRNSPPPPKNCLIYETMAAVSGNSHGSRDPSGSTSSVAPMEAPQAPQILPAVLAGPPSASAQVPPRRSGGRLRRPPESPPSGAPLKVRTGAHHGRPGSPGNGSPQIGRPRAPPRSSHERIGRQDAARDPRTYNFPNSVASCCDGGGLEGGAKLSVRVAHRPPPQSEWALPPRPRPELTPSAHSVQGSSGTPRFDLMPPGLPFGFKAAAIRSNRCKAAPAELPRSTPCSLASPRSKLKGMGGPVVLSYASATPTPHGVGAHLSVGGIGSASTTVYQCCNAAPNLGQNRNTFF